ncbi:MAG: hypothetical protein AB1432_08350 [Bacteroidota bacterium]|jgi:hypothetical protein
MEEAKIEQKHLTGEDVKAWVISATMGYGHNRAVHPLREIAEEKIITVGAGDAASKNEEKLWKRLLGAYEFMSRAKGIPIIGKPIFNLLDALLHIPSYYPMRDLSNATFQVDLLESSIKKGLCSAMLDKIRTKNLPIVTSFYASAIAADMKGFHNVYCIICDADLNRVWAARQPWESRIDYFAPCGKAAQRLKAYGVPDQRIYITGFPLPSELIGGEEMTVLKKNLGRRLVNLDPRKVFRGRHEKNVEHFIGINNYIESVKSKLTISYAVGGAGALKEIGGKIAFSLKNKILSGEVKLILIAGTKRNVNDYFRSVKNQITDNDSQIEIIYSDSLDEYFEKFNHAMHETDILWTKPSELTFYCGLGIPIIMTPTIGSQEKFNRQWLFEVQAGIKQMNPEYTDQWLYDLLNDGVLAEMAWSGFLKARKLGTYKIIEVLKTGRITYSKSPVLR